MFKDIKPADENSNPAKTVNEILEELKKLEAADEAEKAEN